MPFFKAKMIRFFIFISLMGVYVCVFVSLRQSGLLVMLVVHTVDTQLGAITKSDTKNISTYFQHHIPVTKQHNNLLFTFFYSVILVLEKKFCDLI